jgi:predicted restriction endonuclease
MEMWVKTGSQISVVRTRLGQAQFAANVKDLYRNKCSFPGCQVSDRRFLVASHIAPWSDNEKLRGNLGNGLCLCLMHDKAFEMGIFTLDQHCQVFVNPKEIASGSKIAQELGARHGRQITLSSVKPLDDALLEHWIRVGLEP